ncbi:DUF4360 domain-containing protein [Kitasatospora sp. NPDC101157]|uniref:DUF4360 domain-containing protein n=1 Tax=Kitasatospora sp. NPDC101157 TaxID=3364098 RepID=UPI00382E969B
MLLRLLAATSVATSLFGSPAFADSLPLPPPPPQDRIVIDSVTANGTGCPTGTSAVAVSPDGTAFTVTYSNYIAQIGPGTSPADARKDCQLSLRVHAPGGYTYAVVSAGYSGFASLAAGASATQRAGYRFQGDPRTTTSNHHFKGPFDNNWRTTDTVPVAALVFAPCGEERSLDITTELQIDRGTSSPSATSFMEMDSTDGRITTVYRLALQRCQ